VTEYENEFDDEWDENYKSKTQIKQELNELKELGRDLIALPVTDLDKLSLPEDVYDNVLKAKKMSHGALKRQVGFLGGIIAKSDYETIQSDFKKLRQAHNGKVKEFHQLEQWRDELLANNKDILNVLVATFENIDIQYVRQLVRNAQKESQQDKAPKTARVLFKYLQSLQEGLS
jgi:ribosome-associated protein